MGVWKSYRRPIPFVPLFCDYCKSSDACPFLTMVSTSSGWEFREHDKDYDRETSVFS